MMFRRHHILLGLCAAWMLAGAQAQVVRCTDARTGKVTYTDGACAGGAAAREVEPRKSAEELQLERELAAEALDRKQQRLQAETSAAEAETLRNAERDRARAAQAAAAAPQPQDYARSAECARSRRNLDVVTSSVARSTYAQNLRAQAAQRQVDLDCLGPEGYARVENARAAGSGGAAPVVVVPPYYPVRPVRPAPPSPPPSKNFTQCNVFRCYDGKGNSYPR